MRLDYLAILRDHLRDNVKDAVFNIRRWSNVGMQEEFKEPCGSSACAVGHACFIPLFRTLGLELVKTNGSNEYFPMFNRKTDIDAAVAFFELSYKDASSLFYSHVRSEDPTRLEVVKKITEFLNSHGAA